MHATAEILHEHEHISTHRDLKIYIYLINYAFILFYLYFSIYLLISINIFLVIFTRLSSNLAIYALIKSSLLVCFLPTFFF